MNIPKTTLLFAGAAFAGLLLSSCVTREAHTADPRTDKSGTHRKGVSDDGEGSTFIAIGHKAPEPRPIADFTSKGIGFLLASQHENGGWGGGSHARQNVRDPHAVQTDPGTTSFTAMALMRAGHTPFAGEHREAVRKAAIYVLEAVEKAPAEGPRITDLQGTQLQSKLGSIVDTAMAAQFLSLVLPHAESEPAFQGRLEVALDKCLRKIESSQNKDGGWTTQGWAPVLQSAMNNQALELGAVVGRKVDDTVLQRSRDYQRKGIDARTGAVSPERARDAAGISLYAGTAAQRANASGAARVDAAVEKARKEGALDADAEVNSENLKKLGYSPAEANSMAESYRLNRQLANKLDDDNYLAGFGNNGGEEFISFMMSSESLVISGGEVWERWNDRMHKLFEAIQNADGSWHGHHCITSPVICTAAAVLCLTTDRDAHILMQTMTLVSAGEDKKSGADK